MVVVIVAVANKCNTPHGSNLLHSGRAVEFNDVGLKNQRRSIETKKRGRCFASAFPLTTHKHHRLTLSFFVVSFSSHYKTPLYSLLRSLLQLHNHPPTPNT
ncbi:hypothetical protein RJT34_11851 [Clitoria ternatea]|uniref:Uncharacterized protein n=1 Tax=Clitoria ternatea TaxID=43366 RepID=A0AAN9JNA9_CLITE